VFDTHVLPAPADNPGYRPGAGFPCRAVPGAPGRVPAVGRLP